MDQKSTRNPYPITYKVGVSDLSSHPTVRGEPYVNIQSLKCMGFQGSKVYQSYLAIVHAIKNGYTLVLGFTSNAISGGMRDLITQLCRLKLVHVVVTTGGGIEEDLIKTVVPFLYSKNPGSDVRLYELGVNRTENIFCLNEGYVWLEQFLNKLGETPSFYKTDPVSLVSKMSSEINSEESYLHWCYKNGILVLPLGLEDCAIGDHFAMKHYESLWKSQEPPLLNSSVLLPTYLNLLYSRDRPKICVVCLGGGAPKHFIMNGLIPVGGSDMTLYFNKGDFYEGSNAGAPPEESISWGKSKVDSLVHKVYGDFYFTFYLVASQLIKDFSI